MQKIKSLQGAEQIARELESRMEIGQKVSGNTWIIERGNNKSLTENPFDFEFTVSRRNSDYRPRPMSVDGLAHFLLFPERKAINDALEIIESQL